MPKTTKTELLEALKEFGVISKNNLQAALNEYGVVAKNDLSNALKEYGVVTQSELKRELSNYPTKDDLKLEILKSERRTAIRLTRVKNDLAIRIANVAVAKEERSVVEKLEKRVTTLENFQFA